MEIKDRGNGCLVKLKVIGEIMNLFLDLSFVCQEQALRKTANWGYT